MKPNALLASLALAVLLAGCAQSTSNASSSVAAAASAALASGAQTTSTPAVAPLMLNVNAYLPTQNATLTVTGAVNHAAKVSIGAVTTTASGDWSLNVPVEFGHTNLTVIADDGHATLSVKLLAIRLASVKFDVTYTMAVPPHASSSDTVWYDPDGHASAYMYTANKTEHPPIASVHDVMVAWTAQTGTHITYSGPGSFGFSVEAIDGVGAPLSNGTPPYWCYKLDGDGSTVLGISSQPVKPGDDVAWDFAGCT